MRSFSLTMLPGADPEVDPVCLALVMQDGSEATFVACLCIPSSRPYAAIRHALETEHMSGRISLIALPGAGDSYQAFALDTKGTLRTHRSSCGAAP
jgi:hypothetical protein